MITFYRLKFAFVDVQTGKINYIGFMFMHSSYCWGLELWSIFIFDCTCLYSVSYCTFPPISLFIYLYQEEAWLLYCLRNGKCRMLLLGFFFLCKYQLLIVYYKLFRLCLGSFAGFRKKKVLFIINCTLFYKVIKNEQDDMFASFYWQRAENRIRTPSA